MKSFYKNIKNSSYFRFKKHIDVNKPYYFEKHVLYDDGAQFYIAQLFTIEQIKILIEAPHIKKVIDISEIIYLLLIGL